MEYKQAEGFITDMGLSKYSLDGFEIEELLNFFSGVKHANVWRDNLMTIDKKNNFIDTFYKYFYKKISKSKIESIINWLTYKKGYFIFGQKIFIEFGDYLVLPSAFLQHINCYVPFTNFLFNPKTGLINKSVSNNQALILRSELQEKMESPTFIIEKPLLGQNRGEIDLAVYDGKDILILEIKGCAIRVDLKERENLLKTTLTKADYQLRKLSDKFNDKESTDYEWLKRELQISSDAVPNIYYMIICTSFEWDDLTSLKFPKYSLFTLLNLLRNDRFFFSVDDTDFLFAYSNLAKKDYDNKELLYEITEFNQRNIYFDGKITILDLVEKLKINSVWSFLDN